MVSGRAAAVLRAASLRADLPRAAPRRLVARAQAGLRHHGWCPGYRRRHRAGDLTDQAGDADESIGLSDGDGDGDADRHSDPRPDRSQQQLRQIANGDRPFVSVRLADRWVPQLSSKRPGVVDQGIVWDNATTLREHLQLRERYHARLLWSGEWSTFSASNFWVTVAGSTFPTSAGALAWCTSQGFDRDHCFAKIVSTTHSVEGSTAYNR